MPHQSVIALDLGATKVACVVANDGALLGAGVAAYPAPRASWPDDAQVIGQAVERALEAAGSAGGRGRVVVAVSHPELSHARVTASIDLSSDEPVPVRAHDVSRLRQHALSQALGIDREALLLEPLSYRGSGFDQVRDPRTLLTTRLSGTFALVSVPLALRQRITQGVEAAGLDVDRLVYGAQALAVSCAAPDTAERLLLVDIGGCSTECVLLECGHLLRSLTVPWGGMHAVEAIASRCRTTRDQALALSLQGGSSPKAAVASVWQAQMFALAAGLRQVLFGEPLPSRALVTGRGALVDGMVEWVQEATGIPATLARSSRSTHLNDIGQQLALSTAFGIVDLVAHQAPAVPSISRRSAGLVHRLLARTQFVLTEYF